MGSLRNSSCAILFAQKNMEVDIILRRGKYFRSEKHKQNKAIYSEKIKNIISQTYVKYFQRMFGTFLRQ